MTPKRSSALLVAAFCVVGTARTACAEGRGTAPLDTVPMTPKLSPWDQGNWRPFVGGHVDVGVIFARPAIMAGWGQPHWMWFGVEAYALTTNSFFATYVGTVAHLPIADLSFGLRDNWSYVRSLLPPKTSYAAEDVDDVHGAHARYLALDTELSLVAPLPGGFAFGGVLATTVLDVPSDRYVYEEGMRAILRPPFAADFRLGYLLKLGPEDVVKAGVLTETVVLPHRDGPIFRAGPVVSVSLTEHTEGIFVFTAVLRSPDSLGIWHGPYGFLGVRYRFATGDAAPKFP